MSSSPPSSESTRPFRLGAFGGRFKKKTSSHKVPSNSASPQLSGPSTGVHPSSPLPRSELIPTGNSNNYLSAPSHIIVQRAAASAPNMAPGPSSASTSAIVGNSVDPAACAPNTSSGGPEAGGRDPNQPWEGLEIALKALQGAARLFPPLQSVLGTLISGLELFKTAVECPTRECESLVSDLEGLAKALTRHLDREEYMDISDCITNIVQNLNTEVEYINKMKERNTAMRILSAKEDPQGLVGHYRRIESAFRLVQIDAYMSTWDIAKKQLENTRLEALSPAKTANYDSAVPNQVVRGKCTENTRTDVLSGMNSWSNNHGAAKVYWLNGMAGTGKTTIACSLSVALANRKQLGASFFCTHVLDECRDVLRILPTIAYQLARYSRVFQHALCKILDEDPDDAKRNILTQFRRLLREPLINVRVAMPGNLVIVIDALDECDDDGLVRELLGLLFQYVADLPLKFFVASRPEPEIIDTMLSSGENLRTVLHLHEIERSSVQADIELYLRNELASMPPNEDELQQLVKLSDNLFIYAATVVRYIQLRKKPANSQERLRAVLTILPTSNRVYAELDALYTTILKGVLDDNDLEEWEIDRVRLVLWASVCVWEPVSVRTLALLTGLGEKYTKAIVQSLRSVLYLREASGLVSTFHASFPDFIFNRERSRKFFCDKESYALLLTQQCFEVMKAELRFNICNLESSFLLDEQVEDLEEQLFESISGALSYACRYWGDHFSLAVPSKKLCIMLEEFLSRRLLFWMEILNLIKANPQGISMLQKIQKWLQANAACSDLSSVVSDVEMFMKTFSGNAISLSTPHIYISALPLFHKSIPTLAGYWEHMRGLITIEGTAMEQIGPASLTRLARWEEPDPDGRLKFVSQLEGHADLHYLTISVPALDGEWELRPSGWVVNQADEHLVWVPLHPQVPLSCPSRLGIVGPQGSSCMMISYNDMFLGDSWSRCYVGE